MGSQNFSAQYQQAPIPAGGALIQADWFRTYVRAPDRGPDDRVVQSWDTATMTGPTNDYSVCTTWLIRDRQYFLLDVLRKRLEYPNLRRQVLSHAAAYAPTAVLIEKAGNGAPLIQDLWREGKLRPIGIPVDRDKVVRLEAQSAVIEAGYVLLPERAAWLDDFRDEMLAFPYGRHDDQVDTVSQFLEWAEKRQFVRRPKMYLYSTSGRMRVYGGGPA
jgi:predicted phage terminase large subunit-like protein